MTVNLLISAVFQVLLFSIIPFIWWLVTARKETQFLTWLGFQKIKPHNKRTYFASFIVVSFVFVIPGYMAVLFFMDASAMATSQFLGKGISALIPVLIYAFLQTGLSEELFFRGFLTKRLIHRFGFQLGNSMQCLLFGCMHGAFFITLLNPFELIIIILITGVGGVSAWLDQRKAIERIHSFKLAHPRHCEYNILHMGFI